jgi:hypothetical protein
MSRLPKQQYTGSKCGAEWGAAVEEEKRMSPCVKAEAEISSTPRHISPGTEISFPKLLSQLSDVDRRMSSFNGKIRNSVNLKMMFAAVTDAIPQIVVWGHQSAGKSSVISSVFNVQLPIGTGITTLCPIVLKYGPEYSKTTTFTIEQYQPSGTMQVANLEDALNFVSEQAGGKLSQNFMIILEIYKEMSLIITDLPGCTATDRGYFNHLRERFLVRPQTIILYVARGDCDPDADVSAPYLSDISENQIIPVLTHSDMWLAQPSSKVYLQRYAEKVKPYNASLVAVVNNRAVSDQRTNGSIHDEEAAMLESMKLSLNNGKRLIVGSKALLMFSLEQLEVKTRANLPLIKTAVVAAKDAIDIIFRSIGRSQPDMRELVGEFRKEMTLLATREFRDSNTELAHSTNESRKAVSVEAIRKFMRIIPTPSELRVQMQSGTRGSLQGSEGWDGIIRKYSSMIVEEIKRELVAVFVPSHAEVLKAACYKLLEKPYRPATAALQRSMLQDVDRLVTSCEEKFQARINESIDVISLCQYDASEAYMQEWNEAVEFDAIQATVLFLSQQTNKADALTRAHANIREFAQHISHSMEGSRDPYMKKAKIAHAQLTSFWNSKATEIHNGIIQQIERFERDLGDSLIGKIMGAESSELIEPVEISRERAQLVDISNRCDELLQTLS